MLIQNLDFNIVCHSCVVWLWIYRLKRQFRETFKMLSRCLARSSRHNIEFHLWLICLPIGSIQRLGVKDIESLMPEWLLRQSRWVFHGLHGRSGQAVIHGLLLNLNFTFVSPALWEVDGLHLQSILLYRIRLERLLSWLVWVSAEERGSWLWGDVCSTGFINLGACDWMSGPLMVIANYIITNLVLPLM